MIKVHLVTKAIGSTAIQVFYVDAITLHPSDSADDDVRIDAGQIAELGLADIEDVEPPSPPPHA